MAAENIYDQCMFFLASDPTSRVGSHSYFSDSNVNACIAKEGIYKTWLHSKGKRQGNRYLSQEIIV